MNNVDILGEEATVRQIIEDDYSATNGYFEDSYATSIGSHKFYGSTLMVAKFPNVTTVGNYAFGGRADSPWMRKRLLPKAQNIDSSQGGYFLYLYDCGMSTSVTFWNSRFYKLCAVVLRSSSVSSLGSTSPLDRVESPFIDPNRYGYIYVPRNLISSYQSATNWATLYASKPTLFRALEDYTVDGTTTGELDESKMFVPVTPIYTLENREFNGTSDYIDTEIKMFDGNHSRMTIILDEYISANTGSRSVLECFNTSQNSGFKYSNYNLTKHGLRWAPPPDTTSTVHLNEDDFKSGYRIKSAFIIDGTSLYKIGVILNFLTKSSFKSLNGNADFSQTYTRTVANPGTIQETLLIGCGRDSSGNPANFFSGRINKLKIYDTWIPDWQLVEELNITPEDIP